MRPTNFAIAFFLVMVLSMVTPATAQFGPSSQVFIFSHEVDPYGQSELKVFTTQCTENYQIFFALAKRQEVGNGGWVDLPRLIPIGIEPSAPGVMKRYKLGRSLEPGTYKLSPTNLSQYGNRDRNVKTVPCVSNLSQYAQTEDFIFTVGGQAEAIADGPTIMVGDRYSRLNRKEGETGIARFWGSFQNASRLIVFQELADHTVRYSISEQAATPSGMIEQVSLELPNNFDDSLPVQLYAKDKSTDQSVSLEVLRSNPVLADSARTNR